MKEATEKLNDGEIVDAKNFKVAERLAVDPLEKEERAAAQKNAKDAPKGAYIVACNRLKADKKEFVRGDEYHGKLYPELLAAKSIVPKEEWAKR